VLKRCAAYGSHAYRLAISKPAKISASRYYYALYAEKLEMLYFIIEPIISRTELSFLPPTSDDDIANTIIRIIG
jgi:hypothetical protein